MIRAPSKLLIPGALVSRRLGRLPAASPRRLRKLQSVPVAQRMDNTIAGRHFRVAIGADGTDRKAEVSDIFTVRNGLIIHMRAYADPDRAYRD
jgi:ketosteroid isomerase-like protein